MAPLEAQTVVELDTELDEVADARGGFRGEHLHRARAAQTAPGAKGVLRMELRIVVLPDRGRDASLCEQARRREKRPLREDEHVTLGCGAERGEQPCDASTDDDERELAIVTCLSRIPHASFSL